MSEHTSTRQHGGAADGDTAPAARPPIRLLSGPGWARLKVAAAAAVILAGGGASAYGAHQHVAGRRPTTLAADRALHVPLDEHPGPRLARWVGGPPAEAQGQRADGDADAGVATTGLTTGPAA